MWNLKHFIFCWFLGRERAKNGQNLNQEGRYQRIWVLHAKKGHVKFMWKCPLSGRGKFHFWTFPNRIDQKRFESKSMTLSGSFCRFYRHSAHFGPKWRSRGPGRGLNLFEFVEKSLGISEPIIESIKIVFNPNHWPWAAIMDDFTYFGPFCGPKGRSFGD